MTVITPVVLFIFDIDLFKGVNEKYGYNIGDLVLSWVAGVLQKGVRTGADIVGRFGGEEFVVMLTGCTEEMAVKVGMELRRKVAILRPMGVPINVDPDLPRCQQSEHFQVTISAGVRVLRGPSDTYESMFEDANKALHHAKHEAGRDALVVQNGDGTFTVHKEPAVTPTVAVTPAAPTT